jgi:hypothetical protein
VQRRTCRVHASALAACIALAGSLVLLAANRQLTPRADEILARFNAPAPPPYRAFRRLEGGLNESSGRQAWMEAWTEFAPNTGFTYKVVNEGGHEYVRNKILRNVLRSEQELLAHGKPLRAPLVSRNYTFADGGIEGELQRILLNPSRKSDGIVKGSVLINPEAGSVVQMEGRLMKSPSFWIRDVDVTWKYARLGAHDLPVEMISSARVRLFGRSRFKMSYQYVSLEGRPINTGSSTPRN